MFTSVHVERIHTEIGKQIARRIISGDLQPGEVLPTESELTKNFEVSRSGVREALRSLAQRGLLEQSQGKRTVIRPPEDWDIFDQMVLMIMREEGKIYPVLKDFTWIRLNLEPEVAAEAARLGDTELVADLRLIVTQMTELHDRHEGYYLADLGFHARIAAATGNRVLYRLMKVMGSLFTENREMTDAPYVDPRRAIDDHEKIVNAISAGDPEGAAEAMRTHMSWAAQGVSQMYSSGAKLPPLG